MFSPFLPPNPPTTSTTSTHDDTTDQLGRRAEAILEELIGDAPPSIHAILRTRLEAADAGQTVALAPGPAVDRALGRLVEIVTTGGTGHGERGAPLDLAMGTTSDRRQLIGIEAEVRRRLETDPSLARRAADLRRAAGVAETELERHHAARILDGAGTGARHSGSTRTAPTATVDDPLGPAMGGFPYVDNYRLLVAAELAGLTPFRRPRRMVFCGAGALPLTGILANRQSGATIRLVEIDPETAALSRGVLEVLDRRRIVDAALLRVETGDAASIDLSDADVVIVASLVPLPAVHGLVERLSQVAVEQRPLLVVRSASGLVGQFAYDPVDPSIIVAAGGYRHVGTVAPAGREPRGGPPLLASADPSVLNTSEYFVASGATPRR